MTFGSSAALGCSDEALSASTKNEFAEQPLAGSAVCVGGKMFSPSNEISFSSENQPHKGA